MVMIFGKPLPLLFGQLLLGIINGSFYAMLSMGLAIIFGLLKIINFAHGAMFMVGAFVTWGLFTYLEHRLLGGAHLRPGDRRAASVSVSNACLHPAHLQARYPIRPSADLRHRSGAAGPVATNYFGSLRRQL